MSSRVLGIDLGTTNSVVAVADGTRVQVLVDPDGNRLIPSVVSFHPQGDVLVGYPARERRLLDARNTVYSVKRLIGRPFDTPEVSRARSRFAFELVEGPNQTVLVKARKETYSLPEISAFVLREVRRVAEQALGEECCRAVITVPANFNELQRAATKAAGKVAGLEVMRIVNEPTAAALAYGYGRARNSLPPGSRERIAVYDFGGGTFDVTILELSGDVFEVVATAGDTFLGGDDVDLLIAEEMANVFLAHHRFDPRSDGQAYERLRAAAEWSKCQLTLEPEVQLRVEELAYGETGASLDLTFGLSRAALEKLARPLVERTFAVCEEAMRIAGIASTQLDSVLLVGGTTRMPLVRQMVKDYFGQEPQASVDPDLVVAQGAALQGFALRSDRGSMPPGKALARVALKRKAPDAKREARLAEVKEEIQAARPMQPAFAPREAPPPADLERPQPPAASPQPRGRGPAPPSPPAVVTGRSVAVGERKVRASKAPAPPPLPMPAQAPELSVPAFPGLVDDLPMVPSSEPLDLSDPSPPREASARGQLAPAIHPPPAEQPAWPQEQPAWPQEQPAWPQEQPAWPAPVALEIVGSGAPAPLLLDVTPHTLGVETVAGYCEPVIKRNAAIPVEQSRVFTTASDGQLEVRVRIVQGESRRLEENQPLGEILLGGIRQERRGHVKIGVTFVMDASGTLGVKAKDLESGREESIRVQLVGAMPEAEIQRMQERQNQMFGQ
jgi:molecular chaperone DnaK